MPYSDLVRTVCHLCTALDGAYRVTIETPYGLLISVNADGSLTAALKDGTVQSATPGVDEEHKTRYKYRMFPDWGAGFIWYDPSWPGNPEGEFEVDEDDLENRYPAVWLESYRGWKAKYEQAFEEQKCDQGSDQDPFPDAGRRKAWVVEGMLLACWLSLQPDAESVEYQAADVPTLIQNGSGGNILKSFIKTLEDYSF
ncbi:hypothetical protein NKR23_g3392 [Pleurostoma richardsiae]|uniref:Uncharacterized protein n=1 Tax=Pleurostoma richardsiae TaxID=41990 RepID=A0AA38RYP0_9PEZI|nr:hypothetical protein NKR23_g3392 [Pleurostoma richardsiae]